MWAEPYSPYCFDGFFMSEACSFPIPPDLQIIHSPIYTNNVTEIDCTYIFNKDQHERAIPAFRFEEFNFTTSQVSLKGTTKDGPYNKNDPPMDFFLKDSPMSIEVKMTPPTTEYYRLEFSLVDSACSYYKQLTAQDTEFMFHSPPEVLNNGSIITECRWVFEHTDHTKILGLDLFKHHFDNPLDIVSVNDGASELSSPLLQVTTSNVNSTQRQIIRATGPYLWVAFKPKTYASYFSANVTVHGQGGHFKGNGTISMTPTTGNDTVFLLEVDEGKTVLLNFTSSNFEFPATLSIYDDFDQSNLLTNLHGKVWYPVLSKSSKMMIIASGFSKGQFTATFSGVTPGCLHMNTISIDNYVLSGNCNNTCMWVIPPRDIPGSDLLLNLQYLHLSKGDQISIFKMDDSKTPLGEVHSNVTHVPQLVFPANVGALVEINRAACEKESEDVVVVGHSSYLPACGQNLSLSSLAEFQVTSPMYPDTYPILASCSWQLNIAKGNLIHLAFDSMKLAPNHCVKVTHPSDNKTISFDGSKMPGDLLLPGNSVIEFDSANCQGSKLASALESAEGFVLNGTVADCGDSLSGKTSSEFSIIPNKTLCIWKVSVPETEDNANDIVNIISYSVSKKDEIGNYELLVYDGDSVREPRIVNDTKSEIWSRTNNLIFIYKRIDATKPSTILTVKYTTVGCNSTNQCANKICLHPDWRCNGINECGDFTDERNCESVPIPPKQEKGGYSATAFWICIILMLALGALLGVGIPYGYQKFKNGRYHRFDDLSAIH
ncbi:Cubilin like protein [Argiope bruennichi]|uniref:Cubilin like protein n=1 Tax=Argiope bruennichi TaxID=94029 RepID=A0A8T0ENC9_ARGBR|nr:Cubilin like protein [Argiope bruennichi]